MEGNADVVGVAGRTFTDACGDRPAGKTLRPTADEETLFVVEDVEEALEWLWT